MAAVYSKHRSVYDIVKQSAGNSDKAFVFERSDGKYKLAAVYRGSLYLWCPDYQMWMHGRGLKNCAFTLAEIIVQNGQQISRLDYLITHGQEIVEQLKQVKQ